MTQKPGRYDISIDRTRAMMIVTFSGLFNADGALAGYLDDRNAAVTALGGPPNQHRVLYDFADCGPQSRTVLEQFQRSMDDPAYAPRRHAIVVGSVLTRLQLQRVISQSRVACFRSRDDAVAWLTE